QVQKMLGGVLQPVQGVDGDVRALVALEQELLLADTYLGRAGDHGPVLAAPEVFLQREHAAGLDGESLYLAVVAILEHGVAAPRAVYREVMDGGGVVILAQLRDNLLHRLAVLAARNQNGVARIDHDDILEADHS